MWPVIVLIALLLGPAGSWAAQPATERGPESEAGAPRAKDECVACHTSAEKLQALVTPPEAVAEEGEG
jgi:hypothetical protein